MSWLSNDSKKQMRLNVLRHRQKLLKLLENTDDTTLKPRIKFDPNDFDKLLGITIKKEPISDDVEAKEEYVKEPYDSSDDLISVGSNEIWNNTSSSDASKKNNSRKSKRLKSVPYCYRKPSITLTEDHMYALDRVKDNSYQNKNTSISTKKRSPLPLGQRTRSRPRETFDRHKHNAKERACREEIGKRFLELKELCSDLNSNRRTPSKQCILLASKKECDGLTYFEKELMAQKNKLRAKNAILLKKLQKLSRAKAKI